MFNAHIVYFTFLKLNIVTRLYGIDENTLYSWEVNGRHYGFFEENKKEAGGKSEIKMMELFQPVTGVLMVVQTM